METGRPVEGDGSGADTRWRMKGDNEDTQIRTKWQPLV